MMWGGKFGINKAKVYGVWNPFVYPKDRFGNSIYLEKLTAEMDPITLFYTVKNDKGEVVEVDATEDQLIAQGYSKIYCVCDGEIKYIKQVPSDKGHYKYLRKDITLEPDEDQLIPVNALCPQEKIIHETEYSAPIERYSTTYDSSEKDEENLQLKNKKWVGLKRPEVAQIIVDNYGNFDFKNYIFTLREEPGHCAYKEVPVCGVTTQGCNGKVDAYGYIWEDSDIKMTSLEGDQDIYFLENTDVRYRLPVNSSNKEVMIARKGIYKKDDNGLENEIINYSSEDLVFDPLHGLVIKTQLFNSKIDFHKDIKWKVINEDGKEIEKTTRVKVGTFYIMEDWNLSHTTPFDMANPINDGMENTKMIDRMEKIIAKKTFAIDANANLAMFQYFNVKKYSNSNLQAFIDPRTMKPFEPNTDHFNLKNGDIVKGNLRIIKEGQVYYKWSRTIAPKYTSLGKTIIVDATHYPGTFRVVGETWARSREDQKDQRYQFEIPLCKLSAETSLQLQADGEPTTFKMDLKVLRKNDGTMVKLTQYNVEADELGGTRVVPIDTPENGEPTLENERTYWSKTAEPVVSDERLVIHNPIDRTIYHLELDQYAPYYKQDPYLDSYGRALEFDEEDRSKVVVAEEWTETEMVTLTEYEDRDRTIPTGETQQYAHRVISHSKVLKEDEYEFEVIPEEGEE